MVVLAGCTTDAPTDPNSPDTETPESTPSPTPPPEKEQSVDEEVKEAATNIRSKDVPHDAQDHLRSSLTGLYADLPENESERKDEMRDIAAEVCADREAIPYEDIIEGSGDLHEYTYTIGHTSQTMNEQFSAGLNTDRIGSRMSSARGVTAPVSKYAPLVGSYNRFHEAACAFEVGEPGSEEEFYVATAALTMELVLLQYGVFYKASFRATGTAANKLSLMKIYHACGANCYKLTLSQIHWGVRGTLAQASGYAISKSSEIGVELREEDFDQEEVYDTLREQYDDWWESDDELLTPP